jgi:hypothetical protein
LQKELGNMQELNLSKGQFATQTDADILGRERKSCPGEQAFGLQVANTATDNALAAKKEGGRDLPPEAAAYPA